MAERRMFTLKIVDSDAFLDMPASTQALYFHLAMRADDDGFVNNPKKVQRIFGASEDDLRLLIVKRFIIGFETGVIVIKHWRMHNTLRKDRYNPTQYQEELAMLSIKENGAYTDRGNQLATTRQPDGNHSAPQYRIDKDSKDKLSIDIKADAFADFAKDDKEMLQLLRDFAEMRRKKNKPMTDRAKQMLVNKLESIPESERKKAVGDAILYSWSSVYYEPKKDGNEITPVVLEDGETDRILRLAREMEA